MMRTRAFGVCVASWMLMLSACGSEESSGGAAPTGTGGQGGAVATDAAPGAGGTPSGAGGSTRDAAADGGCAPSDGSGIFKAPNVWTKDVSCEPPHADSAKMMNALAALGGWGTGLTKLQIDWSLMVLHADASTPMVPFTKASGYYTPDCDDISQMPLPALGAIEGQTGYQCSGGDCHLLVLHGPSNKLYEVYQANYDGTSVSGTCAVVWDITKTYPDNMRGEQCTSVDAAGFPMSAMLPDADEVASGEVLHAIRFALPNPRIRAGVYVHPASHAGGPSGGADLPPYGARLRLRADFPLSTLASDAARVLARALMRFGMFMSDGGNVPLMVQGDAFTQHKWADLNLDTHALFGVAPTDFDVVDMGSPITLTYDCVRNP